MLNIDFSLLPGLLSAPGDGLPRHAITSTRFRLGPQQRGVLRFKWASFDISVQKQQVATTTATIHINRVQQDRPGGSSSIAPLHQTPWQEDPLASFRVVALQQPPVADRTLRLYHAAGPGSATATYAVLFGALPAGERLVCGDLRVMCGPGMDATVMRGEEVKRRWWGVPLQLLHCLERGLACLFVVPHVASQVSALASLDYFCCLPHVASQVPAPTSSPACCSPSRRRRRAPRCATISQPLAGLAARPAAGQQRAAPWSAGRSSCTACLAWS